MDTRKVVITGLGVISPLGLNIGELWEALSSGASGVGPTTSFDAAGFDSRIAAEVKSFEPSAFMPPKSARRMDRFCQFGVAAAVQAVKDAGLDMEKEDPRRVGVYVGSGVGGLSTIQTQHRILLERGPGRISPFLVPMMIIDLLPGQIAIQLGCKGPNLSVVTACASGNHSLGEAMGAIRNGQADVMIAGGAEASITSLGVAGFCAMKALSTRNDEPTRASRPFDRDRDGFVIGEGAGILVLEELEHARRRGARIYAELAGYGLSADAYHLTAPAPGGEGAVTSMELALRDGGAAASEIDYINAHGTSTELNDKLETAAIKTVFGQDAYRIAVSSTKSMHGHLLGAAGGLEAAISVLALVNQVVPPTVNYENPDPDCDLDYVPNQARSAKIGAVLSNAFGFGGHNATLLFRKNIF